MVQWFKKKEEPKEEIKTIIYSLADVKKKINDLSSQLNDTRFTGGHKAFRDLVELTVNLKILSLGHCKDEKELLKLQGGIGALTDVINYLEQVFENEKRKHLGKNKKEARTYIKPQNSSAVDY